MDKDIRKKVLLDIFADPLTLIPAVGGLSALLLAWATGAGPILTFLGLAGILGGVGWLATRLIFGIEKLTEEAFAEVLKAKKEKRERELDELDTKLVADRDPRDQNALRRLRTMHESFEQQVKEGKIDSSLSEKLEELFNGCVNQLKHSHDLWETSRSLSGKAKQKVLDEREILIDEVLASVDSYGTAIEQLKTAVVKRNNASLSGLRDDLERSLEIAKRVEQRMSGIDKPEKIYDESEFQ